MAILESDHVVKADENSTGYIRKCCAISPGCQHLKACNHCGNANMIKALNT